MRNIVTTLGMAGFLVLLSSSIWSADETDTAPVVYGFGTPATTEEIAAWDIDVMPDGEGLPAGSGTVAEGAELYAVQCAACHGFNGEGGLNDRLVMHSPNETVGNYWPYATTVFDYIRRSMPYNLPGSLEDDEVYALTAHLLYLNNIIPEDAEMNAETLPKVEMPARGKFVVDDRQNYQEVH
jgi:cytochrome c